jgi:hypothetical protein
MVCSCPECQSILQLLSRLALWAASNKISNTATDDLLAHLYEEAGKETGCFNPGQQKYIPKRCDDLYDAVASPHATDLYEYDCCTNCNVLRRCEVKDLEVCPDCEKPWNDTQKYFGVLDGYEADFNVAYISRLLHYTSSVEHTPGEQLQQLQVC